MADIVITAANVVSGANAAFSSGTAGESVTAGQPVYVKGSDGKLYKSKNNGTAEEATVAGVALHASSAGQPLKYQTGGAVTIGATVVVGETYVVSATYGGICPVADLTSAKVLSYVGYASTASLLVLTVNPTGVTHG